MKIEPSMINHIRFTKSGPKSYLVTYYYEDNPILKTYTAKDKDQLLLQIAKTLSLASTVCLEHYDFREYSTVELRSNWKLYYKLKENIFYSLFYIFIFAILYYSLSILFFKMVITYV